MNRFDFLITKIFLPYEQFNVIFVNLITFPFLFLDLT